MADYNLKVITADTDGPSADTELLFGSPDQSSGTPKPYSVGGMATYVRSKFATSGSPHFPFYLNADTGLGPLIMGSQAALTLSSGRLHMIPFVVPETKTFVGFNVGAVTSAASGGVRVGLYNANQTTRQPTTLIVDAGIVDMDTTTWGGAGKKTKAFSQALTPSLYYAAFLPNSSTIALTGCGTVANSGVLGYNMSSGGTLTVIGALHIVGQTYQPFSVALSDVGPSGSNLTFTPIANNFPFFMLT